METSKRKNEHDKEEEISKKNAQHKSSNCISESNSTIDFYKILNKYVSVWLWSIAFATTTGVMYSFCHASRSWGLGSLIMLLFVGTGMFISLLCLSELIRYLRYFIIPQFLRDKSDSINTVWSKDRAAKVLTKVFSLLLSAIFLRGITALFDIVLTVLGDF